MSTGDIWRNRLSGVLSALAGGVAVGRASQKYPGAAEAIASALAVRLREVLPVERYEITAHGPVLDVKFPGGGSTSLLGLLLIEKGSAEEKLERVFEQAAAQLQPMLAGAYRRRGWSDEFEPHVRVSPESVTLWWGGSSEENAAVSFPPIARSEIGL